MISAIARSVAPWLLVALGVWLDQAAPAPAVVRADFGATAAVVAIIGFLSSLFSFFGRGASEAVRKGLVALRDGLKALGGELLAFIGQTKILFSKIVAALRKFWRDVLRPLFVQLDTWIRRGFKWLRDTFGPILEALQWLRAKILELYTKWLRPIFDTIDAIRRVLSVLSLFHIDWAKKLDAKLAELEDRLLEPIRFALRKINEVIDVVDRIVTVDGLLQKYTLLASAVRDIRLLAGIWADTFREPLTDEQRRAALSRTPVKSGAEVIRESESYLRVGDGPHAAVISEYASDLVLRLRTAP